MADALAGGNVQAMQQFIGVSAWDDDAVLRRHQQLVAETLGDPETGVLIVDGCDFPKQGAHSVGVAPQWCGALGKVANCQASVLACYASARGYTLVDRRLYLPEEWFTAAYAARRDACGVPGGTTFQTRTALAWAMITGLRERGALPFWWVTGDEHFGNTPALLDQIADAGCRTSWKCPTTCGSGGSGRPWPCPRRPARKATRSRGCDSRRARPTQCGSMHWRPPCRRTPGSQR
jgi:SRSO17 transposase